MEFRQARIEDVDSMNELFLLAIERREFPDSREEVEEIVKNRHERFTSDGLTKFVAVEDGKVVAYVLYGTYSDFGNKDKAVTERFDTKDCAYILAFVAHPDYRGKDVAKKVVDLAIKDAKEKGYRGVYCTADEKNICSRKFQLKCGFKEILVFKDPKRKGGDTTALFYQDL